MTTATRKFTGQTLEGFLRGAKVSLFHRLVALCQIHGIAADGRAAFYTAKTPNFHPADPESAAQATDEVLPTVRGWLCVAPGRLLHVSDDVDDLLRVQLNTDPLSECFTADAKLLATVRRNCVGGRKLQWYTIKDDDHLQQYRICGVVDGRVVAIVALCI